MFHIILCFNLLQNSLSSTCYIIAEQIIKRRFLTYYHNITGSHFITKDCLETIFLFIYHTPIYKNELYNQYQNIIYYEIQIYLIKIYLSILQD